MGIPPSNYRNSVELREIALSVTDQPIPPLENPSPESEIHTSLVPTSQSLIETKIQQADQYFKQQEFDLALDRYTDVIITAEKEKSIPPLAYALRQIGHSCMQKQISQQYNIFRDKYRRALIFINSALALQLQQKNNNLVVINHIFEEMIDIEKAFLRNILNIPKERIDHSYQDYSILNKREKLSKIRHKWDNEINVIGITEEGAFIMRKSHFDMQWFTEDIVRFLNEYVEEIFQIMGPPPGQYAIVSMGSLARGEICPFSDLEFAIIVDQPKRDYWVQFSQVLEMKIINLGETESKVLNRGYESAMPKGFSFDDGGNTPLGKQGQIELIMTPQDLAKTQNDRFFEEDFVLSNALNCLGMIKGNAELLHQYENFANVYLEQKISPSLSTRQKRAKEMMIDHVKQFKVELNKERENLALFNVKQELYRLPSMILITIAYYYGLKEKGTLKRLSELNNKGLLSSASLKKISEVMNLIFYFRVKAHQFYNMEREDFHHTTALEYAKGDKIVSATDPIDGTAILCFSHADVKALRDIMQVNILLAHFAEDFCSIDEKEAFNRLNKGLLNINEEEITPIADQNKISDLMKSFQINLAVNPNNPKSLYDMGVLLYKQNRYKESLGYILKNYQMSKEELSHVGGVIDVGGIKTITEEDVFSFHLQNVQMLCQIYCCLNDFENLDNSLQEMDEVTSILEKYQSISIYLCYLNVSDALSENDNRCEQAKVYLNKAVRFYLKRFPDLNVTANIEAHKKQLKEANIPSLCKIYHLFTKACRDVNEKMNHLQLCYNYALQLFGENHEETQTIVESMAYLFIQVENTEQAIKYFLLALKISRAIHVTNHESMSLYLNNLGSLYLSMDENELALKFLNEALSIEVDLFGNAHPNLIIKYFNIGRAQVAIDKIQEAICSFEKGIEIIKKTETSNRKDAIPIYMLLCRLYLFNVSAVENALSYLDDALSYYKEDEDHLDPQDTNYNELLYLKAVAHKHKGEFLQATEMGIRMLKRHKLSKGVEGGAYSNLCMQFADYGLKAELYEDAAHLFEEALANPMRDFNNHILCFKNLFTAYKAAKNSLKAFETGEKLLTFLGNHKSISFEGKSVLVQDMVHMAKIGGNEAKQQQYLSLLSLLRPKSNSPDLFANIGEIYNQVSTISLQQGTRLINYNVQEIKAHIISQLQLIEQIETEKGEFAMELIPHLDKLTEYWGLLDDHNKQMDCQERVLFIMTHHSAIAVSRLISIAKQYISLQQADKAIPHLQQAVSILDQEQSDKADLLYLLHIAYHNARQPIQARVLGLEFLKLLAHTNRQSDLRYESIKSDVLLTPSELIDIEGNNTPSSPANEEATSKVKCCCLIL